MREGRVGAKWLYRVGIYTSDFNTVPLDSRSSLNAFKWSGDLLNCNTNDQGDSHYAINSKHIYPPFLTSNSLNQCQWQKPRVTCWASRWKQQGKGEREIYLSRLKMYMHNLLSYPNSTLNPCLFSSKQLLSDRSPGVDRLVLKTMVVYLSLSVLGWRWGWGSKGEKKTL